MGDWKDLRDAIIDGSEHYEHEEGELTSRARITALEAELREARAECERLRCTRIPKDDVGIPYDEWKDFASQEEWLSEEAELAEVSGVDIQHNWPKLLGLQDDLERSWIRRQDSLHIWNAWTAVMCFACSYEMWRREFGDCAQSRGKFVDEVFVLRAERERLKSPAVVMGERNAGRRLRTARGSEGAWVMGCPFADLSDTIRDAPGHQLYAQRRADRAARNIAHALAVVGAIELGWQLRGQADRLERTVASMFEAWKRREGMGG